MRTQVLTVPSGSPSFSAISVCERPVVIGELDHLRAGFRSAAKVRCGSGARIGIQHVAFAIYEQGGMFPNIQFVNIFIHACACRPDVVDRSVAGNSKHPRTEGALAGFEQVNAVPDAKECFLNQVLSDGVGTRMTSDDGADHRPHDTSEAIVEMRHGFRITPLQLMDEIDFGSGRWAAHLERQNDSGQRH